MFDDIRINFIKYVLIRNYSCHEDQIIFVKNRYPISFSLFLIQIEYFIIEIIIYRNSHSN